MGILGGIGLIGSEITKFCSEKNKNISTLIKNSSEQKFFSSELFALISGVFFRASKLSVITDK